MRVRVRACCVRLHVSAVNMICKYGKTFCDETVCQEDPWQILFSSRARGCDGLLISRNYRAWFVVLAKMVLCWYADAAPLQKGRAYENISFFAWQSQCMQACIQQDDVLRMILPHMHSACAPVSLVQYDHYRHFGTES